MTRKLFGLFSVGGGPADRDIQAGSKGLTTEEIVERYLKHPGHVLALLRFFAKETTAHVAATTHVPEDILTQYEKGQRPPSLQHLMSLSNHYQADKGLMLSIFGHTKAGAAAETLGIAAQFQGSLSADEKLDLKRVIEAFAKKRGPKEPQE